MGASSHSAIVRQTWLAMWRERRLQWVLAMAVMLAVVAALHGSWQLELMENQRLAAETKDRETFVEQGERNPHSVAHFSRFAMRPALAVTMLDIGIRPYAGSAIWMEAHWQGLPGLRQAEDQVDLGRGLEINPAWVVQIVLPLLLVLLGFDGIASERSNGTLSLLRGNGIPLLRLVTAKVSALWQIACVLLGTVLLTTVAAGLISGAGLDGDFLLRSLLWFFINAVYLAIWSIIIIGLSLRFRPMMVFLLLIAIWVSMTLVLPRVSAAIADALVPTPSADAFVSDIRNDIKQGINGHNPSDSRRKALEKRVLEQYGVSKLEDLPVSFAGIALQESEEYSNQVFDRHFNDLNQLYLTKERIRRLFALATPLIALQPVSMSLADSGLFSHIDFIQQAESQRREIVKALNEDMIKHGVGKDFEYHANRELWQRIPEYSHRNYPISKVFTDSLVDLLLLVIWLMLCAWILYRRVRREETAQ